jgi:positive regulator of sigma E activity
MSERIVHEGIIDHISTDSVFVRILSKSACAECHSNGICSISEMTEKLIEIKVINPDFVVGQIVNVILDRSLGNKAVVLGYLFPFLLMIITLLIASHFFNELLSGLLAIAVLIPYFLLLSVFKNRLSKTFSFHIEKL